MKTLLFITGNANKLAEVQAILAGKVELISRELDLPELQGSIEEVSSDKCRRAVEIVLIIHKPSRVHAMILGHANFHPVL